MGVFQYWPNRITALRFVGALVLFWILAQDESRRTLGLFVDRGWLRWAFWTFILVAVSDILDGWLARRGNHVTAFGRIADPFVDKVLVLGTMVFLAVLPWSENWFPAWIVVVVLARELLITAIRGYVERMGGELSADWFGKVKMFAQCFAIGIVIGMKAFDIETPFWSSTATVFVWLTLVTSIGSCLSYMFKTRRFLLDDGGANVRSVRAQIVDTTPDVAREKHGAG
ncbi:MAG: CDP-alcohol phosphatidyltransferase family protein [Planctomycetota bacterium]|nr:CDP-alcohol phosphatidyltransferase family protein [Planctomycetota bacterium]